MSNKIRDAFDSVKLDEELKTSTIQFLQAQRQHQNNKKTLSPIFKIVPAVCLILILALGTGGYFAVQTPVSFVSIDVNPSIELALNRFDRVVSATAFNEDGTFVLNGLELKGKKYTEAIDSIIMSRNMDPFLSDDAEVIFTVAADDSDKEQIIRSEIDSCPSCMEHGGQSSCADVDIVSTAHEHGMSLGKYSAYLELAEYDETITIDECHDMSVSDIHHQIDAHRHSEEYQSTDVNEDSYNKDATETHGEGHHNGHHE